MLSQMFIPGIHETSPFMIFETFLLNFKPSLFFLFLFFFATMSLNVTCCWRGAAFVKCFLLKVSSISNADVKAGCF